MIRMTTRIVGVALVAGVLLASVASTQPATPVPAQEYALQDYMPQTVGSTWTVKQTRGMDTSTRTIDISTTVDVGEIKVPLALTNDEEGWPQSGTIELVTAENYTIYGTMRRQRWQEGGEVTTMTMYATTTMYDPPLAFPGTLTVGQTAEATAKIKFGEREFETTMKLTLEAVEDVTVPKGTFEGCLKLVTTRTSGEPEMKSSVWYAKGVGAVKTERPGTTTELEDYEIAEAE